MSVLIKGMEMPTTCRDCRLSTFTDFDSMPFCNITMDDICLNDWETKRCDNCPLVSVPPHGDLIERKAAYDSLLDGMVMTGYQSRALDCIAEYSVPTIIPPSGGKEDE